MKNKHILFTAIMAIVAVITMTACNKNTSAENNVPEGKQQLSLYITDGPGLFDHVYLDIRSVKVLVDTSADTRRHDNDDWDRRGAMEKKDSSFVWEDLNISGVIDILQFRNGADTLFKAANIAKGSIRLIKIEIGNNNSVVKDSVTYPVPLPSGANNYVLIKLKGHECDQFLPGKIRLWIDFDITRSILVDFRNQFYMRPFFHFFTVNTTASINGKITPRDALPVVTIYNATDTAYALPNKDGFFKTRGLKDGTYSVYINASNGYADTTINNVVVKAPGETSIGNIKLSKQ